MLRFTGTWFSCRVKTGHWVRRLFSEDRNKRATIECRGEGWEQSNVPYCLGSG